MRAVLTSNTSRVCELQIRLIGQGSGFQAFNINNLAVPGINVPPLPTGFPITKMPLPVLFWNAGVFTSFVEFHVQN